MTRWVNRVAFGRGSIGVRFRSAPKADLNSDPLTIVAQKRADGRCAEARGSRSGGGARSLKPQWVRDIIADCRRGGVVPFHKQWGTYSNNPLVVERGMSIVEAKALDKFGKGGGLVDGKLVREFPMRPQVSRNAA